MKGKGGKNKNSRSNRQEAKPITKKSDLSYRELKENLQMVINSLGTLVLRCKEKTELATFLTSVSSQFCFEEKQVIYGDTNLVETFTIEDELDALRYS